MSEQSRLIRVSLKRLRCIYSFLLASQCTAVLYSLLVTCPAENASCCFRGRGQGMGRGRGLDPGASGSADIAAQLSDTHLNPPIPQPANTETPAYGLAPSFVGSSSQQ